MVRLLEGKRITVGVTGGIGAYKAAELVSRLRDEGAGVRVVMTHTAQEFISPLTLQVLSGGTVYTGLFEGADPLPHITLARESDLLVIYPATAHFIGQAAWGLASDLLTTLLLAFEGPVVICPAMNARMYASSPVQENLRRLAARGYIIVLPETGRLACGETGPGRLPPPETAVEFIRGALVPKDMAGIGVLVTAGPTREAIDPVRYLTNRSSGKMGYAVARAARDRGARVTLISGPTTLPPPPGIAFKAVETALEMREAVLEAFGAADVVVMAAAVSDYRPAIFSQEKIKKGTISLSLELVPNPDILEELGRVKGKRLLVGFAAETGDLVAHAQAKALKKNLDLVVANDVRQEGAGFAVDTNVVSLVFRDGQFLELPKVDKYAVAHRILDAVLELREDKVGRG
ncbi:bifunctional phosphopantothenoylcysteine decarboxylase/phosphopantothenate--cysteine ligase CoaBC [Thermodesulfitimonas sp.]